MIWGTYYHTFGQNIKIFKILCTKYMASIVRWWHHQLTHLHYSYRLVKKCFVKICETSKCHNFLIFQPIFIRFSLLCLKCFTLSSKLKLILLWSSSLKQSFHHNLRHCLRFSSLIIIMQIVQWSLWMVIGGTHIAGWEKRAKNVWIRSRRYTRVP